MEENRGKRQTNEGKSQKNLRKLKEKTLKKIIRQKNWQKIEKS